MSESKIQQSVEFLKAVRELQRVYRHTPKPDGGFENDAEHSWSVAVACMILTPLLEEELDVKLDQAKLLKMALIHDLAEIETGDTKTWDMENRINKEENERIGIEKLVKLLPSQAGAELFGLWEECEAKQSLEAQIVKSVDRFDPVIHRTAFNVGWDNVEDGHSDVEALNARQYPRHQFSKVLTAVFETVRDEAVEKSLFK